MALHCFNFLTQMRASFTLTFPTQSAIQPSRSRTTSTPFLCLASARQTSDRAPTAGRRSANYKPNIWEHDYMTTLKNDFQDEVYLRRAKALKNEVRQLLENEARGSAIGLLELVDDIQRVGMEHIFEEEIKVALNSAKKMKIDESLHAMSLYFRLFRQHGFQVSQDIFKVFQDSQGNFNRSICQDVKGLLNLYEASYLAREGEDVLDEAKVFARTHLEDVKKNITDPELSNMVNHALGLPLNLGNLRLETRWYIDAYERRKDTNHVILELAKLDYNMVQAVYLDDVVDMSKWWKELGLSKKLTFARDRLVEAFLWGVGMAYEPQYNYCRKGIGKLIIVVTMIDDIYDVYSTLDEAKLFTDAVNRWDLSAVEQLPYYMKICFLALYNTANEFAYNALRDHGMNILPYFPKLWSDLCNCYLLEAKWFHSGYKPTLEEYLENAWLSSASPLVLFHTYVFTHTEITKEALDYLATYPRLVRWSSLITRLIDDIETSKAELERGDVPKAMQCYMHHAGVTEEVARKHIRHLTDETWKKMNAELCDSPLPVYFGKIAVNFARTTESFYQYGDGYGVPDGETKGQVLSLLFDTIPVE